MDAQGDIDFFEKVLPTEHSAINHRRNRLGRPPIRKISAPVQEGVEAPLRNAFIYDTVGLALSGGGIRSAALSLGVLQALNAFDLLRKVDYLSTVSGGGYTGSSLTATMTVTGGDFVF